jgi:plastocyanin
MAASNGSPTPAPAPASDYQVIEVKNGGSLAITVLHPGKPEQVVTDVHRDQKTCGSQITTPVVEIAAGGLLQNAVVFIEEIERGKAPDLGASAKLDNRGCRFVPHVQTVTVGQTIEITNSDPILHNTHAYAGNRTVFNLALVQGQQIPKKITTPGVMNIKCDYGHAWMDAWIHAFPHPYHAVTGADGIALITGVPPGKYRVGAWHQALGRQTREVVVEAGKPVQVTFNLDPCWPRPVTKPSL